MASEVDQDIRPIEKYYTQMQVVEDEFNDPPVMEALQDLAKETVAERFDAEGYEAIEDPVVRVLPHLFGGEVVDLGNGRSITYVAQIVATIRGFKR